VWRSIGDANVMPIAEARELARDVVKEIKTGIKPQSPKVPQTVADVCEVYYQREVLKKGLRSAAEIRRTLDNHILPTLGDRMFEQLAKRDVVALIDAIEDKVGVCAADRTLTRIKTISSWYADRHDDYLDPFAGMKRRISQKERERSRIMSDDEIRLLWKHTGSDIFGAMVRMMLVTGQRKEKICTMRWEDIEKGVWTISTETREKGNAGELVLPKMAQELLAAQPRFASNPFVFAGRRRYYNGLSKAKARLDAILEAELKAKDKKAKLEQWGLHDLRRTARSLMSRAGVAPHIAERLLGHSMKGVMATYDRHSYREEKAGALELLAGELRQILSPDNVVKLAKQAS
jgi:integrase